MAFAALSDVNVHLPVDKLQMEESYLPEYLIDSERLVRARLASVVDVALFTEWDEPANTPEIIREIVGKISAAKFYANMSAEDEADGSKFAQDLYNDAIQMLNDIRDGILVIVGVDGETIVETDALSSTSFYPNATAPDPFFAIADEWA